MIGHKLLASIDAHRLLAGLHEIDDRLHPVRGHQQRILLRGRAYRACFAKLIEQYGDAKLPELRHVLANCPKGEVVQRS